MHMLPRDLLDSADLAARLGVSPDTIRRWAREGRIPAIRVSRKVVRYQLDRVIACLESQDKADGQGVVR